MAVQCLTGGKDQIKCVDEGMHKAWGKYTLQFLSNFSECSEYVGHYSSPPLRTEAVLTSEGR